MKNKIVEKLVERHGYTKSFAESEADRIMNALPYAPSLSANVNEWISEQPISDIFVGRFCVRNVLKVRGHEEVINRPGDIEILNVIFSILMYAADPVIGKTLIMNVRR